VFPGHPMEIRRAEEPTSFWVYLPPSANPADGQRRVAEVRELGVTDVLLVPDGTFRGAISLGIFRQEALAQARQRTLAELGVRHPRIAPRSAGTRSSLRVSPVPPGLPAELVKLQAGFPEATARVCPGSGPTQDAAAR
jgi:hypothetical protein